MARGQNLRGAYVSLGEGDTWNEVELTPEGKATKSERRQPVVITPEMAERARVTRAEQEAALKAFPRPLPAIGHIVVPQVLSVAQDGSEALIRLHMDGQLLRPDGVWEIQPGDYTVKVELKRVKSASGDGVWGT